MQTIWTNGGEPINLGNPQDAPVRLMIEYQKLENEGRQLEGALLLLEGMLEFKEDMEIIKNMSVNDMTKLLSDWMASYDS